MIFFREGKQWSLLKSIYPLILFEENPKKNTNYFHLSLFSNNLL